MHTLIVGARGIGKSTLIRRVLDVIDRPVFGFETKKEDDLADEVHGSPVYIFEVGKAREHSEENLVGYCMVQQPEMYKEAFDRFVPKLIAPAPEGSILLMDEIGFMESVSESFCSAVISLLDGDIPVIAAVKDMEDIPFLDQVRSHKNCRCFYVNEENREDMFSEVLEFVKGQMDKQ